METNATSASSLLGPIYGTGWYLFWIIATLGLFVIFIILIRHKTGSTQIPIAISIIVLAVFSTYLLFFNDPSYTNGMEWAVALGTIILATVTYFSVIENQKNFRIGRQDTDRAIEATQKLTAEMAKDRKAQFLKSQLDDFYSTLIDPGFENDVRVWKSREIELHIEYLEGKKYLASNEMIQELDVYKLRLRALNDEGVYDSSDPVGEQYRSESEKLFRWLEMIMKK